MKPEKQRIAIAEAFGLPKPYSMWYGRLANTLCHSVIAKDGWKSGIPIPDYLNDLNAMHEAEKVLILDCEWATYLDRLSVIVAEGSLVHATSAQRAEAFLRTIQKWEDDK